MDQQSAEWRAARLGKVTASRVSDVMAKGRNGEPSRTRASYMAELICERLTGEPYDSYQSADMERGSLVEGRAKSTYELLTGLPMTDGGFDAHPVIADFGASPDMLVGSDGLAEFKCPKSSTHIDSLLGDKIDRAYVLQMQAQMACTGRKWCDFVSFDPRMPLDMQMIITRVGRDDVMIAEMEKEVSTFLSDMTAKIEALNSKFKVAA